MSLAIVGSRRLTDQRVVFDHISKFMGESESMTWFAIVSGGAAGVDAHARVYAQKYELVLTEFLPDYKKYPSQRAPLIRNTQIVNHADEVLAIVCECSRGTWDTINKAKKKNKRVTIIRERCLHC